MRRKKRTTKPTTWAVAGGTKKAVAAKRKRGHGGQQGQHRRRNENVRRPKGYAPQPDADARVAAAPDEILAAIHVDLDKLAVSNKTVRLNVTIPERAVALIDHAAKLAGTSRSGFLTQAALTFIERHSKAG